VAHEPRPHGAFQQGAPASDEDAGVAAHTLKRLQALKEAGGLPGYKLVRELPDGGHVIALDQGGVVKTITVKPEHLEPERPELRGIARLDIPMLYSGNIETAVVPDGEPVTLRPTDQTRRRLRSYKPFDDDDGGGLDSVGAIGATLKLHRFRVELGPKNSELMPKPPAPGRTYTHFDQLHSTWFTGAMAAVVQVVKGFGVLDKEQLPEDEWVRLQIPEGVRISIERELGPSVRLPGYTGVPPLSGQIQYNYKANDTDAVGFDSGGKPWLVKVSSGASAPAGVWAMPLPVIPATTTQAFRLWMEKVGDTEIITILDRFGAIPSGEGFPLGSGRFEAWRKAGVIIKVCDTADFYDFLPYSNACGFAFNKAGTEAYGTCWEFREHEPNKGYAYQLTLQLGPVKDLGMVSPQSASPGLNEYMAALLTEIAGYEGDPGPIYYKLRRQTPDELAAAAAAGHGLSYWLNLEMPPIAEHTGSCARVGDGWLLGYLEAAKWPEPFWPEPACLTSDAFRWPKDEGLTPEKHPPCDTIVYGFYDAEDRLKVVKYFREPRKPSDEGDEPPSCMHLGSYEWRGPSTGREILGRFYTSDFDDRVMRPEGYTLYRSSGEHMLPGEWRVQQESFFWAYFQTYRYEYYLSEFSETAYDRHNLAVGTLIPWGLREAYLYAKGESDVVGSSVSSKWWGAVLNRNRFHYWSYDPGAAWIGAPRSGKPVPYYPYPDGYEYSIYESASTNQAPDPDCYPEANEADWAPTENELAEALRSNSWRFEGTGGMQSGVEFHHEKPKWKPITEVRGQETRNEKHSVHFCYGGKPLQVADKYVPDYFRPSPEPLTMATYWVWGCGNCIGDAEYRFISEGMRHVGASKYISNQGQQKRIPRFIGVIHE